MRRAAAVLGLVAAAALPACAGGALTLYEENDDLLLEHGRDADYTQGARISRVFPSAEVPEVVLGIAERSPFYDERELNTVGFVAGQTMYTPRHTETDRLVRHDRPYAGWLYAGVVVATQELRSPDRADDDQESLEIDVGVVGDESLAREVQDRFHQITGAAKSQGWENQLAFEPGLVATYERRRRVASLSLPAGLGADLIPSYGASAGNVDTHVEAGFTGRIGFALPRDFGVNTISTTAMETASSARDAPTSVYVFGGGEGRGVVRNVFLDGNTFRESHSVDKRHLVGEFRAGLAFQHGSLRLTYTMITVSPEYRGQHGWTRYGSVSVGLFLDF